ncbi:mitogen-activated protein kinase kinase kinase 19 [Stegostoma tigrinum]|uniref:mitogen-activated protein kinase kinase kinase 19 n=1 Tax=Stegostoma tigrinum TaxID=3053191 RepID=UPI00286FF136|nr:mitogen-activated protein kinase kinase kinase 19 [Stegostoma tigrinum]
MKPVQSRMKKDEINPMLDFLVIAPERSLETKVQSQNWTNDTETKSINLEHSGIGCTSLTDAAEKGYTELGQRLLDINCNKHNGLTPLTLTVQDVDMLEKLRDLKPAETVQEFFEHNERSASQCAAQVKNTAGKYLPDVLPNQLSPQGNFLEYGEPNGLNVDLGFCSSQMSTVNSENINCLMRRNKGLASEKDNVLVKQSDGTNTEFHRQTQGPPILLAFNTANNALREMICLYNDLETNSAETTLENTGKGLKREKRHSSLPDEMLLASVKLKGPSLLNAPTRRNKWIENVPALGIITGMHGSQSEPIINYTETHLDCSQGSQTHKQKLKKKGATDSENSSNTFKLSLPQLITNNAKSSVPEQHLSIQGRIIDKLNDNSTISNVTATTLPSKHPCHSLSPYESITKKKGPNNQSLALSYRQETSDEFSSASVPSNQKLFTVDQCPECTQGFEPQCTLASEIGYGIKNNELNLTLPMPLNDSKYVASGTRIKHEPLDEEISQHLFTKDVTHSTPTKNTYCTSAESDEKCKYKEADIAGTNLDEVVDASYCKDSITLLDTIQCSQLNLENSEPLKGSTNADFFNMTTISPEENTNFQDVQHSKISVSETLLCKEELEPSDNLFQNNNLKENINHKGTTQNLAENFGQSATIPKKAVRTKYAIFIKENVARKDKIDLKSTSAIHVTAKQSPAKAQNFLKVNPVKMKSVSKAMPYKGNQSLKILISKEPEQKKKISKVNCVNQRNVSTPERTNKCSANSLQCLAIPTQSWLKKSTFMPSTAQLLKYKGGPSLPLLKDPDLHQVPSKVKTKGQVGIKCLLRNGSLSNEQNLPNISRISNSLNKSPVLQVSRSHFTNDFSALKYSDMFQEINPTEKGPGIYEMFGTPMYCITRKSTNCESNHKVIHSIPPRRQSICKKSKSNQVTTRNTAKISKSNLNSKHKRSPGNVKKNVDENAGEKNTPLFSDEGPENVVLAGHHCHVKTYRKEALSHELINQEKSGNPSDGINSLHSLSNNKDELDNQYLSTITEISFKQTSNKSNISEDLYKESSTSVNGDDPGHDATDQSKFYSLGARKDADCLATDLFELQQQLNITLNEDVDLGKGSQIVECRGTTDAQEPTTALTNPVIWDVREDESESIALCTEDQDNTIFSTVKDASNPDFNLNGFPVQRMINTWTTEEVCPPHCLDRNSPDSLTEELLACLASELLLEEQNTCTDTTEVTKPFLQKEDDSKNGLFQNGYGKLNENSLQSAEYTVTKLCKTSSRSNSSLGYSMKSESSSSCEDAIIWTKGNVLGKGAYGTVYCGLTSQGKLIAVKQVSLDATNHIAAEKEYQKLEEEIELLKNLKHVNIVSFLGTNLEANVVSIFMEFVPGGSIAGIISRFGPLPEPVFCTYTKQILKGVNYLHDNRVIHRDIKGNNVMLMPNGVIKLIDFGCAKRMTYVNMSDTHSEMLISMHGTPYWMAPEVINETGHGKKSDIWSIGCTVFEMASGKPPLAHMDKIAAMFYIGAYRGQMPNLPEEFSENARDFVQICLTSDQHERPSAKHLLQHPFITKKQ